MENGAQIHINDDAVLINVGPQGFQMQMNRSVVGIRFCTLQNDKLQDKKGLKRNLDSVVLVWENASMVTKFRGKNIMTVKRRCLGCLRGEDVAKNTQIARQDTFLLRLGRDCFWHM